MRLPTRQDGIENRDKVFCLDIIENFHLILNNYCFFRITVEYVKLTLRPS